MGNTIVGFRYSPILNFKLKISKPEPTVTLTCFSSWHKVNILIYCSWINVYPPSSTVLMSTLSSSSNWSAQIPCTGPPLLLSPGTLFFGEIPTKWLPSSGKNSMWNVSGQQCWKGIRLHTCLSNWGRGSVGISDYKSMHPDQDKV